MSRWLKWKPGTPEILTDTPGTEVPKVPKGDFGTFGTAPCGENPIIQGPELAASPKPELNNRTLPQPREAKSAKSLERCPYTLPVGIDLVSFQPKTRVAINLYSVVTDVPAFIDRALAELTARLHSPIQIRAGDGVFELLSKLAEVGLELRISWPPSTEEDR